MHTTRTLLLVLALLVFGAPAALAQPGDDQPISPYGDDEPTADSSGPKPPKATAKAPAPAEPDVPPDHAVIRHVPPTEAEAGSKLKLIAVIENGWVEDGLVANYRVTGTAEYTSVDFERSSAGGYFALIPARDIGREGVEYYITGRKTGALHFGSAENPHPVRVEPATEDRWIEVERARLGDYRYAVDASLEYFDFGNTHGRDRFARGHVDWSHLLVDELYAINLGFAFLQGGTPSGLMADAVNNDARVRYGYGGVRWRMADKVWVDGKAMMGFGEKGFAAGVGGALTLGNDWRTAVTVGGEAMTELSYKAFIRLQWDTVPGVLMSAEVATTNQPDAQIDAGSYVEYRIRYPFTKAMELAGSVNFAARGNRPGGFGGGLHTRYMF